MNRLIIGCGYLGGRVAHAWMGRGDNVWALTRSPARATEFNQHGILPLVGDVLDRQSLGALPAVDTVLYAVGYDRDAGASRRSVYIDGLQNILTALPEGCGRLVYVSSTSVYGQNQGEWVHESSPCRPTTERGAICLAAEQVARTLFRGPHGVSVLRLSGIYGPGRLAARIEGLRQQQPIPADPRGWVNLIHVDDARMALERCADAATAVETLVVSDDHPLRRRDYYAQLTAAIGSRPAVFATSASSDRGKRCSNRLLRQSQGMTLAYPRLSDGLPTAIAGMAMP